MWKGIVQRTQPLDVGAFESQEQRKGGGRSYVGGGRSLSLSCAFHMCFFIRFSYMLFTHASSSAFHMCFPHFHMIFICVCMCFRSSAREEGARMWEVGGAYRRPGAARRHLTFLPSEVFNLQRPYVPMLFPNAQYLNRLSADPVKMNHTLKHCFLSYCIHHLRP